MRTRLTISLHLADPCFAEAIRYLDFCPLSTLDGDDAQLKGAYEALYAPLLLNAALCALKVRLGVRGRILLTTYCRTATTTAH